MAEKEQEKPLAPASQHRVLDIELEKDDDHRVWSTEEMKKKKKKKNRENINSKCIKWCGCITALLLILAVVALVLKFTVLHIKDPVLKVNSVTIQGLKVGGALGSNPLLPGTNLTLISDVSVKNPNFASFKFDNTTTSVYYGGKIVGEALTPAGIAKARKTVRLNVTVDVLVDQIWTVPRLGSDLLAGVLPVSSYTKISGKVKILKIVKKGVVVRMNCTMNIDIRSQSITDQNCKRHVSF
ncbi:OLC1v1029891C1 [Oldenlandia corymbosa var. corymbosa]|uniref:OLC1v1029891C1 n=1 Tax=Oldenlandia corymbosa var. corymbosa TaxID=529605 RepID=A0AAV1CI39_OLDCO|nr:OLC1v1029891C1 [Oldenlandia corymbosa var. corymbosa]